MRNRIAHHEPIHAVTIATWHDDLLFVVRAVCPVTADWVRTTSRVARLLDAKP